MASARATSPMRLFATLLAAAGFATGAEAGPRGVIELFTSQGCSSCPPADALLAKLARDPDIIALSLPVDYWDRLGWKDTLAKHAFTERQVAYSNVRGDGQVYTPQAVVNGQVHAVGSQRSAIDDAIAGTAAGLSVPLSVKRAGDDIIVSVGAAQSGASQGKLVLLPVLASRDVVIGRGENAKQHHHLHQRRARHRPPRRLGWNTARSCDPGRKIQGLRWRRRAAANGIAPGARGDSRRRPLGPALVLRW